jgi:gamma-glutamyltranspeptidase
MLNILEGYDFSKIPWGSTEHVHLFTEVKKLVFEDRAKFYADMDFADVSVAELISKEYAAERRKLIDMNRAASTVEAGNPALKDGDTIYLTVADKDGKKDTKLVILSEPTAVIRQSVTTQRKVYFGAMESRKDGMAAGY